MSKAGNTLPVFLAYSEHGMNKNKRKSLPLVRHLVIALEFYKMCAHACPKTKYTQSKATQTFCPMQKQMIK